MPNSVPTLSIHKLSTRDMLAALLVIVLWGMNFVPTKYALLDFTPFQLGAARFLLAAAPLILFIPRPQIPLRWLLVYGLTQGVGQFGLLFLALQIGMTAALVSVLMQMQIFFTALMGALLLGERISLASKLGMTLAGIGLGCFALSVAYDSGLAATSWTGFILTLMAASMWACSNIIVKKIQTSGLVCTPLSLIAWSSLVSGVIFVVISVVFDPVEVRWSWLQASVTSWVSLLYLAWMANGLAYWLWTVLLTRHPVSRVAPFSLGIPVVGMLAGIFILGEQVSRLQWVGVTFVMAALVFVIFSSIYSLGKLSRHYRREL